MNTPKRPPVVVRAIEFGTGRVITYMYSLGSKRRTKRRGC